MQVASALGAAHTRGHCPPRHQARKHHAPERRHREGARFRTSEAGRGRGPRTDRRERRHGAWRSARHRPGTCRRSRHVASTRTHAPTSGVLASSSTNCLPVVRLSTGRTTSDVIAAILKTEPPPLTRYADDAPPELDRIVTKALQKDREERYQDVKDLALDLKSLKRRLDFDADLHEPQARREARRAHKRKRIVRLRRRWTPRTPQRDQVIKGATAVDDRASNSTTRGSTARRRAMSVMLVTGAVAIVALLYAAYLRVSRRNRRPEYRLNRRAAIHQRERRSGSPGTCRTASARR